MERICLTALEEMSFENVDGRRTDDGRQMPVYTISSPMSRLAKNVLSGLPTSGSYTNQAVQP